MILARYEGPCKIMCPLKCDVPEDVVMSEVPVPRHAWGDMLVCPHVDEPCGLAFLVAEAPPVVT